LEGPFLESQQLAAIGETTAKVVHHLRNPLQSLTAAIYLLKEALSGAKVANRLDLDKLLSTLDDQVLCMEEIISDLQDFSNPLRVEMTEVNLLELIRKTLEIVGIPHGVEVSIVVQDDLSRTLVDPTLTRRILSNLISNAFEAMSRGGKLTVTGSKKVEAVTISIRDTGDGVSPQNLGRIFDPFFTTKPTGLGLGLSVCRRYVEAMGGAVTVSSELGRGSCFTVTVPTR